jgi:hypothetical protein
MEFTKVNMLTLRPPEFDERAYQHVWSHVETRTIHDDICDK